MTHLKKMSYRFVDSFRARPGWNCSSILVLLLRTIKTKIYIANVVRTSNHANYEVKYEYYEVLSCNYLENTAVQILYVQVTVRRGLEL